MKAIAILLFISFSVFGTLHECADCESLTVITAITEASNGDTISIPSGNCNWHGAQLRISSGKNLYVYGAGIDNTVIDSGGFKLYSDSSRISNIYMNHIGNGIGINVYGERNIIDRCKFCSATSGAIAVFCLGISPVYAKPVVAYCVFMNTRAVSYSAEGFRALEHPNIASWAQPVGFGTDSFLVVENCYYDATGNMTNAVDCNYGGKYVFRYNYLFNSYVEFHALQHDTRGGKAFEIYNNTFTSNDPPGGGNSRPFLIRGGTGVVYNNIIGISTYSQPLRIDIDYRRSCESFHTYARNCRGNNPWDGNYPIDSAGLGHHDGADNSAILYYEPAPWENVTLDSMYVWNITDGSEGLITRHTSDSIIATLEGGTDNDWDANDSFKVTDGWPCRDQIGTSTDEWQWTSENPYPPQTLEPLYQWNNVNTQYDSIIKFAPNYACDFAVNHLKENRDYFNGIEKPNYTPYTYPHPLLYEQCYVDSITDGDTVRVRGRRFLGAAGDSGYIKIGGATATAIVWDDTLITYEKGSLAGNIIVRNAGSFLDTLLRYKYSSNAQRIIDTLKGIVEVPLWPSKIWIDTSSDGETWGVFDSTQGIAGFRDTFNLQVGKQHRTRATTYKVIE